jgi:large subunit ribosomal protein L3
VFKPRASFVDVTGTSIGRGFAGVIKSPPLRGLGEHSHGTHEYFRHGGSIGTNMTPGRTMPGIKMPGQLGNVARSTVQNLKRRPSVVAEENLVLLEGAVPGAAEGVVTVRTAVKTKKKKA